MRTTNPDRNMTSLREIVDTLDLGPIKLKLMDKEEGHGWTKETADAAETEYKRFLYLVAKYPESVITPDKRTDKFWHAHILDTLKYAEDCDKVFGYFLHHFPYFGMRGEADAKNLAEAACATRELYQREFGASDAGSAAYCGVVSGVRDTAYCGVAAQAREEAYCGATSQADESAYCGAAQRAAYCGSALSSHTGHRGKALSTLNTGVRPTVD